ncbi:zona pellucida-binding protein 2-like [Latimeria chalumnae]|uniref:zona pellucida-binding protein 2-like n=1 Tax=Latimeria chalumnae TaxID=7897 RepID=UPI0006D8E1C1|nr:PREDICTED: zona pellucida-binding protein 2-like isoform X2 [Latimeria chalumnae]|eukprot:XP_014354274.1 PREDICTED: zona pellucida-binding protein 2-like isoform X2 [Latimeria chalumnae]
MPMKLKKPLVKIPLPKPEVITTRGALAYKNASTVVEVYVMLNSQNIFLPCSSWELQNLTLIDPIYQWTNIKGEGFRVSNCVSVNAVGHLVFSIFTVPCSGIYTCSLTYRYRGLSITNRFTFLVIAYHHAEESFQISMDFHTRVCSQEITNMFVQMLMKRLERQVRNLGCEVLEKSAKCDILRSTSNKESKLHLELIVSPYGIFWETQCPPEDKDDRNDCTKQTNQRVKEAYVKIRNIFKTKNTFKFLRTDLPAIHYTVGSFNSIRVAHCKTGFGKNQREEFCPDCCFVCNLGHYSSSESTSCLPCPIGSYSDGYGRVECTNCPGDFITDEKASISKSACVLGSLPGSLEVLMLVTLFTPSILVLCIFCFCIRCYRQIHFKGQTNKVAESTTKFKTRRKKSFEETQTEEESSYSELPTTSCPSKCSLVNTTEPLM